MALQPADLTPDLLTPDECRCVQLTEQDADTELRRRRKAGPFTVPFRFPAGHPLPEGRILAELRRRYHGWDLTVEGGESERRLSLWPKGSTPPGPEAENQALREELARLRAQLAAPAVPTPPELMTLAELAAAEAKRIAAVRRDGNTPLTLEVGQ